jgi:serine/threonine protein kinase
MLTAVGFAHKRNIIHRDIKPSNVQVGEEDVIKIMDFGIAKMMGDRGLTKTGTNVGTISYMSPEQIKGDRDIDQRTDIFSLGVTFYQMLTGRMPYDLDTESDFRLMQEIVEGTIPNPREHYPHISDSTLLVLNTMLEKDRDRRYENCEAVIFALESDVVELKGDATGTTTAPPVLPLDESKSGIKETPPEKPPVTNDKKKVDDKKSVDDDKTVIDTDKTVIDDTPPKDDKTIIDDDKTVIDETPPVLKKDIDKPKKSKTEKKKPVKGPEVQNIQGKPKRRVGRVIAVISVVLILIGAAGYATYKVIESMDDSPVKPDSLSNIDPDTDLSSTPGLYPQGSTKYLEDRDLEGYSVEQLELMMNEIYARNGMIFTDAEVQEYFENQDWYEPRYTSVQNMMTDIELTNIDQITYYMDYLASLDGDVIEGNETDNGQTTTNDYDMSNPPGRYPEGSLGYLSSSDLRKYNDRELMFMLNEIYARHGLIFSDPNLSDYFNKQYWYTPQYSSVSNRLTAVERSNVNLLKGYVEELPDYLDNTDYNNNTTTNDDFVYGRYPEASTRYLTQSDLEGFNARELMFMRNEIFARHGYIFTDPNLADYFKKQYWYSATSSDVSNKLTAIEQANINLIKRVENSR